LCYLQLLVAISCWLVYCINMAHSADCPYLWCSSSWKWQALVLRHNRNPVYKTVNFVPSYSCCLSTSARGIPLGCRCRLGANSFLSNIGNYCPDSITLLRLFNNWHLYCVDVSSCHQQTGAVSFSVSSFGPKNKFICVPYRV
jgi:hypothetical protein